MGSNTQPSAQYPSWNKAWRENESEVDNQIVDYYSSLSDQPVAGELEGKLKDWFKQQRLAPDAGREFKEIQKNRGFFSQQVEERVDYLQQQGRLDQPQQGLKTMQASSGASPLPAQQSSASQRRSPPTDDERQPAYRTPASEDGPASAAAPAGKRNAPPTPGKTKR